MTRAEIASLEAYPLRFDLPDDLLRRMLHCGERKYFQEGYDQAVKDTIKLMRDELNRRLDMYDGLSPETIHPVRLDEERSMIRFLDELEKE